MIIDKKIEINICNSNKKRYEKLGYDCSISPISIYVSDLAKNSKVKIKVKCDYCDNEKEISYYAYNKNIKKYNKYACSLKCCQEKINKTNQKKYNCNRPLQNKEIMNKLEKTNLKKYGFEVAAKNNLIRKNIKNKINNYIKNNKEEFNNYLKKSTNSRKYKVIKKYNNINFLEIKNGIYKIKCEKGHVFEISSNNLFLRKKYNTKICTICNPINKHISGKEILLKEYIYSIYNKEIILNSKKIIYPFELDIFLPDLNIAFEFNGNYWHSLRNNNYHFNKSNKCQNKNIELINIWEKEWDNNVEFIKEWIYNKINNIENIIIQNNLISEYSIVNNYKKYINKFIKRFHSHKINEKCCKLINTIKTQKIDENLYNEGYNIYKII